MVREIQLPGVCQWYGAQLGRWHPDGGREVLLPYEAKLLVISGEGLVLGEWKAPEAPSSIFNLDLLTDLDGNRAADGTDDGHSYVHVFTHDGRVLWVKELGGAFARSRPLVSDLDGDGRSELLVWTAASGEFRANQTGTVMKLDQRGEVVARYDAGVDLSSCWAADLDHDGRKEVLVTDREGFLHRLNAQLTLESKVHVTPNRYSSVTLEIVEVTDLDGDQRPEIVVLSRQIENVSGMNPGNPKGH